MPEPFEGVPQLYPDFNDLVPGEDPLSDGGKWTALFNRPPLKVGNSGGYVHGTVEFAVNGSVYIAQAFTGEVVEAYGCAPGAGLGAALESQRVALWTDPTNLVGYSSGYGGGISESYFFRRYDGGAVGNFVDIGGAHSRDDHPDKIGIRVTPNDVEQWGYYSGEGWVLIQTAVGEMAYRGSFYGSLETEEQGGIEEVGFSCFGGGVPNRQQFFRWLYN